MNPGDRAQKVIPGGAKTNERLSKSQNNVKKSVLRFPTFLFTIALVIERQKLTLEARKQTRASESLKMTSKSQLYDLIHGSDPWIRFMDQIHGSDPWIRSIDQIHGSDPWIRSMDQIHGADPWI